MNQSDSEHECPEGKVLRKSYIRRNTGRPVKRTCVSKPKKDTRITCPPGKIPRSSYTRHVKDKTYTRKTKNGRSIVVHPRSYTSTVGPTCVKNTSRVGRSPNRAVRIGPLKKGELKKFGYSYKLPVEERRKSLQTAIEKLGPLNVYYKLHAVSELTKLTSPRASAVFMEDKKWIKTVYGSENGVLHAF